jgi:nucleosome assembly protein 1-like 1
LWFTREAAQHEESEVMDGEDDDDEDNDDDYDTKVWKLFSLMRNIISTSFPASEYVLTLFISSLEQKNKGTAGGEGQQGKRPTKCKQQ